MTINEFCLLHPHIAMCMLGIFALLIGSLLNVIIFRLPLMLQAKWTIQCQNWLNLPQQPKSSINLFFPRSFCPVCEKTIPAWHNIPLISYVLLRGRCKNCRATIAWRYPLIEGLCLFLSLIAGYIFHFDLTLLFALLFIWFLICIACIDFKHQIIPDELSISLLWLGLLANTQSLFTTLPNAVFSAIGAYLFLWGFIKLYYLITGKIGMGNGDFKLFAALAAWFGWSVLPWVLLISATIGAITGIVYLKVTKQSRDTPIPFGPFLCIAGLGILFFITILK